MTIVNWLHALTGYYMYKLYKGLMSTRIFVPHYSEYVTQVVEDPGFPWGHQPLR